MTKLSPYKLRVVQQVEHVYDIEILATSLDDAKERYYDDGFQVTQAQENMALGGCNHETVEGRK